MLAPAVAGASEGVEPAQVALTSSHNPSVYGQQIVLTARVKPESKGAPTPTGEIEFVDGSTTLGIASLSSRGVAKLSTASLAVGEHLIVAEYGGDGYFGPSESTELAQVVEPAATQVTLTSTRNPAPYGATATLKATISVVRPGAGTPSGAITFYEDESPVATIPLEGKRVATYSLKWHPPGTHEFKATYAGDANYEASESTVLSQTITKAATEVTLKSSRNPSVAGASVTLTATVNVLPPGAGIPTGDVVVLEDGSPIATLPLPEGKRVAKLSLKGHSPGVFGFVAAYAGDSDFEASESTLLFQLIAPYAPEVTGLSLNSGPESGGTVVSIEGQNLAHATEVAFGSTSAQSFEVISPTTIEAVSPPGSGTVDVTVGTPGGVSASSPAGSFTYMPPPSVTGLGPASGPESGGTVVSIEGQNLAYATEVQFGSTPAQSFEVISATTIEAVSPPGSGTVDVTVATPGGVSAVTSSDSFDYLPPPSITSVSPASGPESGGTVVSIEGQNLAHATEVAFGSTSAQSFEVISATTIEAVSPPGSGTADVAVTTPGGASASRPSDEFTYLPPPSVTSISPSSGPESGGAIVMVAGSGFTGATAVTFASDKWGDAEAQSFKVMSPTLIEAVSPAGTGGGFVVVTTPNGVSERTLANLFSFRPPEPVNAYWNYGPATVGHAMCRGNPDRPESMPGGTATQTFTIPSGVASLSSATIQIDPDTTVTAHLTLKINGTTRATTSAAAVGDTHFGWPAVAVKAGDAASLSITFTATFGKIITVYSAAAVGGTLTYTNTCSDGAPSGTTANGLRAVVSGLSP